MASVKFKHNFAGYRDVMNSSGVQTILKGRAQKVKDQANSMLSAEGYHAIDSFEAFTGTLSDGRNVAGVYTHSLHAMRSQNKRKTLTKALNAAKG